MPCGLLQLQGKNLYLVITRGKKEGSALECQDGRARDEPWTLRIHHSGDAVGGWGKRPATVTLSLISSDGEVVWGGGGKGGVLPHMMSGW